MYSWAYAQADPNTLQASTVYWFSGESFGYTGREGIVQGLNTTKGCIAQCEYEGADRNYPITLWRFGGGSITFERSDPDVIWASGDNYEYPFELVTFASTTFIEEFITVDFGDPVDFPGAAFTDITGLQAVTGDFPIVTYDYFQAVKEWETTCTTGYEPDYTINLPNLYSLRDALETVYVGTKCEGCGVDWTGLVNVDKV